MINKKIVRNIFIGIIVFSGVMILFAPQIPALKVYFSSSDIKYFLSLVKKNNEKGIVNLKFYYQRKKEKDNLMYLGCYIHKEKLEKYEKGFKIDWQKCPKNPLTHIIDNTTIFDYLKYKIDVIGGIGTQYITKEQDLTSQ